MSLLGEIIGDHLLSCGDAVRAQAVLQRALKQELAERYPGGASELLEAVHGHLAQKELQADQVSRLWIRAVMLVVQTEMQRRRT